MNQRLWSGLATTAFLISTLGTATSSYADQPSSEDGDSTLSVSLPETSSPNAVASNLPPSPPIDFQADEVSKVGEYQSQEQPEEVEAEAIAIIQPHTLGDRDATTLYVNNIPVLTFLGSTATEPTDPVNPSVQSSLEQNDVKIASAQSDAEIFATAFPPSVPQSTPLEAGSSSDPVWRATAIAAQINQMHQNRIDAASIGVRWDATRERYLIEVNDQELVEINADTILPDTTGDHAEDALQATNRLRRLMGGAAPLTDIEGRPQPVARQVVEVSQLLASGLASWYGPGFNGRRSASGEVFNQNALTAAHRSLPFGTQVRVTNVNTGQSVVVRINDRGPHIRGRIIDLSAGAARAIGLISSGVAPVNIEIVP